jgi:hypothetical protein
MPDEPRKTHFTLDGLLASTPEEAFAMFQHQLRMPISEIGAWIEILIEADSQEERDQAVEALYKRLEQVQRELDFAKDYLTQYHEQKKKSP